MQTAEGKLYLFIAIDRTSKFAFARLVEKASWVTASDFMTALIKAVPYTIHTVLTDNGIQFTFPPHLANGPTARYFTHMFDMRCEENGIEHHLTKVRHLADFIDAYNFGRRLKSLKGLSPYEFICKQRTSTPNRFTLNPLQKMPGLNSRIWRDAS